MCQACPLTTRRKQKNVPLLPPASSLTHCDNPFIIWTRAGVVRGTPGMKKPRRLRPGYFSRGRQFQAQLFQLPCIGEDLFRRSIQGDFSGRHDDNPPGQGGFFHIVGDLHHCGPRVRFSRCRVSSSSRRPAGSSMAVGSSRTRQEGRMASTPSGPAAAFVPRKGGGGRAAGTGTALSARASSTRSRTSGGGTPGFRRRRLRLPPPGC